MNGERQGKALKGMSCSLQCGSEKGLGAPEQNGLLEECFIGQWWPRVWWLCPAVGWELSGHSRALA